MFRFLENKLEWNALPLRVFIGALFLFTGITKATNIEGTTSYLANVGFATLPEFWTYLLIAAEILGGLFILLGILTRLSALVLTIVLIVAIGTVHLENFNVQLFKDAAIMGGLLSLLLQGPGKLSLDQWLLWE